MSKNALQNQICNIHGLVVEQDDVKVVAVACFALFNPGVEESNLEETFNVLDPLGHLQVSQRVSHQDDIVPVAQVLKVRPVVVQGALVLVVDVDLLATNAGHESLLVKGQEVGHNFDVWSEEVVDLARVLHEVTQPGREDETRNFLISQVLEHLVRVFTVLQVGPLDHLRYHVLGDFGLLQQLIGHIIPLYHVGQLVLLGHVRICLNVPILLLDPFGFVLVILAQHVRSLQSSPGIVHTLPIPMDSGQGVVKVHNQLKLVCSSQCQLAQLGPDLSRITNPHLGQAQDLLQ